MIGIGNVMVAVWLLFLRHRPFLAVSGPAIWVRCGRRCGPADPCLLGLLGETNRPQPVAKGTGPVKRCRCSGPRLADGREKTRPRPRAAVGAAAGFGRIAHGEAVAIGLLPALWLSARVTGLDPAVEGEVRELLRHHDLPVTATGLDPAAVRDALSRDKKARAGRVRFTLLEAVGRPVHGVDVADELIDEAIGRALESGAEAG